MNFTVPFNYLDRSHVTVKVGGVVSTGHTWSSASSIRFSTAPAAGVLVAIGRNTPRTVRLVEFAGGSVLRAADLNTAVVQLLYIMQEELDASSDVIVYDPAKGYFDAGGKRIANVDSPIAGNDVLTLQYYTTEVFPKLITYLDKHFEGTTTEIVKSFERFKEILAADNEKFKAGLTLDFDGYKALFNSYVTRVENLQALVASELASVRNVAGEVDATYSNVRSLEASARASDQHATSIVNSMKAFLHKGTWQNGAVYEKQNVVEMGGSSYVLMSGDGTSPPPLGGWALMAHKGLSYFLERIDGGDAETAYISCVDCGRAAGWEGEKNY